MKETQEFFSLYINAFCNFVNSFFPGFSCLILPCLFKILEASWENKTDALKKKYFLNKCCLAYETYLEESFIPIHVETMSPNRFSKENNQNTSRTICSTSGASKCITLFSKYRVKCAYHSMDPWYVFLKEQQIMQIDIFHHKVIQKQCLPHHIKDVLLESNAIYSLRDALEKKCYESFFYRHYNSQGPNARSACTVNTETDASWTMNDKGDLQLCNVKTLCKETSMLQNMHVVLSLELVNVLNFWSALKSCCWKIQWKIKEEEGFSCQLDGHLSLKLSYFENGKIFATHSDMRERSLEFRFPINIEMIVESIVKCMEEEQCQFIHKIEQCYADLHTHVLKQVKRLVAFHQRKFDWNQPNDTIPYNVMCYLSKK